MSCKTCGDTGRVMSGRPIQYETDSAAEREDARRMAQRVCPDCRQRISRTQCCDPVIDSLLGEAKERITALTTELEAARQVFEFSCKEEIETSIRVTTECNGHHGFGSCRDGRDPEYCAACDVRRHIVKLTRTGDKLSVELETAKAENHELLRKVESLQTANATFTRTELENVRLEAENERQRKERNLAEATWRDTAAELVAERDSLRAALLAVEFDSRGHCANWACRGFRHPRPNGRKMDKPHDPDCIVGNALATVRTSRSVQSEEKGGANG